MAMTNAQRQAAWRARRRAAVTVELVPAVTASSSNYWVSRVTVFFAAGVYRRPLFNTADLYKFSEMPRTWSYRERRA